jgi:hypothetical protein
MAQVIHIFRKYLILRFLDSWGLVTSGTPTNYCGDGHNYKEVRRKWERGW